MEGGMFGFGREVDMSNYVDGVGDDDDMPSGSNIISFRLVGKVSYSLIMTRDFNCDDGCIWAMTS